MTPDDVKAVAVPALAHRLTLRPELWVQRVSGEDLVREALDSVPTPGRVTRSGDAAPVKRTASPKLGAYAGLAALGLLAALVLGRPELAVLATPFALVLFAGLLAAREPEIRVALELDRERAVEGEIVTITIDLHAGWPIERLELHVPLPDNLELVDGATPLTLRLAWDEERTIELQARCKRWGGHLIGDLFLRAHDRLDLFGYEGTLDRRQPLKIYPRAEELRSLVTPLETQVFTGNQVARTKGEGIEFADLRRYAYGDSLRRINWRASARRDELWVNEMHPERNTDVIVFLDTFVEAREEDESTLDVAVRAAATLADRYLKRKDRVGLDQLRRLSQLAPARLGARPALPHRRLAARHARSSSATRGRASTSSRRGRCRRRR